MRALRYFVALLAFILFPASFTAAQASILITIDKSAQRMSVSVDGKTRWVWPVSTGRRGYATPSGSYTAFRMEEDHYSKEWDDAPMPHSIFFSKQGHAIHGTFEARRLGTAASHGCVRLSTQHAALLYALVEEQGLPNTKVVVTGEQPNAAVAKSQPAIPEETGTAPLNLAPPRYAQPQGPYYQQGNYQQGNYQQGNYQAGYGYRPDPAPQYRSSPYYYPPATAGEYPAYPRPYYRY